MRTGCALLILMAWLSLPPQNDLRADDSQKDSEKGFVSLFDGKTLAGWDGDPKFWSVKDGTITGRTTKETPTKGNTFLVWTGGEVGDFELKLEYRITPNNDRGFANSGIQYRSFRLKNAPDKWRIGGYQADFEAGDRYSGILYGERFRGILCERGQKTELSRDEKGRLRKKILGRLGDSKEIQKHIKKNDWNSYHIIARGFHFIHRINGVTTAECIDNDRKMRRATGLLALQLHQGPPMTVQFRHIRLRRLKSGGKKGAFRFRLNGPGVRVEVGQGKVGVEAPGVRVQVNRRATAVQTGNGVRVVVNRGKPASPRRRVRKIVFLAGKRSHGYGAHEHRAGCLLLAKALNESGLPVKAIVISGGWPEDPSVLEDADAIVIYADGGRRHPFNAHLKELERLMKKGVGLVCIHYGVEVPKGEPGNAFLKWAGGYFETDWSVNPHWTAQYRKLPRHPVTRGVKPFRINDEWYYHMRFRKNMRGVTPILTDLPPKETLRRKDGPHSGNPAVRAEVARGIPQHMAWATERKDGGRAFGFTGGHFHWNWGHNQFRKLVLNAIVWTAHVEVPPDGVPSQPLTVKDLMANQDYPVPKNFNPARIQKLLDDWNAASEKAPPKTNQR